MKILSLLIFFLASQLVYSQAVQQEEPQKSAQSVSESKVNDTIYTAAEFPGGIPAIRRHIGQEMDILKFKESGQFKSITTFDVNPDGSISSISTTGNSPILNKEMDRIMKKLKTKWKPGTINGRPVKTKYTMPMGLEI
ncbi:energy transducer TonB [Chryseobacterium lactis]|uniref:energy transducer TonB n=1 Tax=Chryseobacterium lactis TaxID=1241981 RepID=UPI0016287801|nr:energy transducer TonB [Chryseobacterium lactis]